MKTKRYDLPTDYEVVQTLATLTGVNRAAWDALSETFAVEFDTAGGAKIFLGFSPEAIETLIADLQIALATRLDMPSA